MRLPEEVIVVRGDSEKAEPPFDISQVRYHRFVEGQPHRAVTQIRTLLRQSERTLDETRDLIVLRMLRSLDPDMMRVLWAVRKRNSFDMAVFDPDRKGLYCLGAGDATEGHLRQLVRALIGRGLFEAGDPGPIPQRIYGGTPEYRITPLGKAVTTRLPRWCGKEGV